MMNNKYIMLDYKEYLDLEITKKYHEENIKLLEGKTIIPNEDYVEYKTLQARVDKAIEYIKDFEIQANHINDDIYLDETLSNKLLEILGGKE